MVAPLLARLINLAFVAGLSGAIWTTPVAAQSLSEKLNQRIGEAHRAESSRNFERALSMYGAALDVPPSGNDRRRVLKMRAKLFEQIEEYARAEDDLTKALAVDPLDPSDYVDRGYFYMRRLRFADAMADFVAGGRLDPQNALYPFAVARVEVALGRYARAVESYDRTLDLDPRNARALLGRAEANVHLGRLRMALSDYTRALALTLNRPDDRFFAFLGRGYVLMVQGELANAVADFDGALAINPNSFNALAWRGYAHEKQGRPDLALADYERASAYDPKDHVMRVSVQRLRGN
jgi:tetratricopeptide (TPR) repeat protein